MPAKLIKLKMELEEYRRKLGLIWHFRMDETQVPHERFKAKSTFNPWNKDAVIEIYPSCLEERFEIPCKIFRNPNKEGHQSL